MKTVNDIRSEFLNFFQKKGHTIVPSSALVPHNDPTLMFTNAGMVQFKDVFTGKEKRPYTRATTAQKCVRAGGKHNDLDNVGYTARHHTFFEMLGNFSFGDYFKEDAIDYAWELVTKNFGLPSEKLCVTVHATDEEAASIWKKVTGFPDHKIIRINSDDNFWRMGDTGPCGPCTEIFYDHGDHIPGGPPGSPEQDGDRFIEIWNNVFMQYEQVDADTRIDLPAQSVDTGMGLERIAATLMGSNNNYDIDIMRALIEHSADLTGYDVKSASHKVVADHIRASAFLMADGVMPSNEGRGYVLRRIMRRGMRHAHLMGADEPLMYKLLPTLISKMGEAYPELKRAEALVSQTLKSEEERFKVTLERGLKMLDEETEKVSSGAKFPGDVAFKLYDTFGFPLDLTQDALKAKKIEVDTAAFESCMNEQKQKARAAWSGTGDISNEKIWFDVLDKFGPTEFLGYEKDEAEGKVLAIYDPQGGKLVESMVFSEIGHGFVITNQTPFYAESGGQVGDTGTIIRINHEDQIGDLSVKATVKRCGKLFVHHVTIDNAYPGAEMLKVGDSVQMKVDTTRRAQIKANHSATHLLHEALREVLGDHVAQKGSLQDESRTRFDISHPQAISKEDIEKVETIVNAQIKANAPVETRLMALEDARAAGAMALFGEKYDDEVRVVSMGTFQNTKSGTRAFSIELCGGTHVKETGQIEKFKIISEGALSSGIRRLEAVTGARVDAYFAEQQQAEQAVADRLMGENKKLREELSALGGSIDDTVPTDTGELEKQNKKFSKEISDQRLAQATRSVNAESEAREIGGIRFIGKVLEGCPAKDLKPMADDLKKKLGSGVVVLVATDSGKASIVVGVTDDLTGKINAVDLVKIGAAALGGQGGGGRPDMAQAGGPDAHAANEGVQAIEKKLAG
ncbi:MAG: alanine--tRNA ligase [Alphaproteobacteria bacterium]|nr:alanine--tRNA ligase [Alphaproteobacteria bacterium]